MITHRFFAAASGEKPPSLHSLLLGARIIPHSSPTASPHLDASPLRIIIIINQAQITQNTFHIQETDDSSAEAVDDAKH